VLGVVRANTATKSSKHPLYLVRIARRVNFLRQRVYQAAVAPVMVATCVQPVKKIQVAAIHLVRFVHLGNGRMKPGKVPVKRFYPVTKKHPMAFCNWNVCRVVTAMVASCDVVHARVASIKINRPPFLAKTSVLDTKVTAVERWNWPVSLGNLALVAVRVVCIAQEGSTKTNRWPHRANRVRRGMVQAKAAAMVLLRVQKFHQGVTLHQTKRPLNAARDTNAKAKIQNPNSVVEVHSKTTPGNGCVWIAAVVCTTIKWVRTNV
jgi:hypothetical protein